MTKRWADGIGTVALALVAAGGVFSAWGRETVNLDFGSPISVFNQVFRLEFQSAYLVE